MNVKTSYKEGQVHVSDGEYGIACGRELYDFQKPLTETDEALTCKACIAQIHIKTRQYGQPRPYADSVYQFEIADLAQERRTKEEMLEIAVNVVRKSVSHSEMPHPFAPERREFSELRPGVWFYHVRELYTG